MKILRKLLGFDDGPPRNMTPAQAEEYYSRPYNPDGIFKYVSKALSVFETPLDVGQAMQDSIIDAGRRLAGK